MRLSGQKIIEGMNYIFRGQLLRSHRLSRQKTKRHVKSRYESRIVTVTIITIIADNER